MFHFLGDFVISPRQQLPSFYDFKNMPDHCHAPLSCKYLHIKSSAVLISVFYVQLTLILRCCCSLFECLEDKPEIDDDIFFSPFARLRWLRVLEERNCVACRASHFFELPCQTSFCLYFFVNLLLPAQHFPLAIVCDSSFKYEYLCIMILCV